MPEQNDERRPRQGAVQMSKCSDAAKIPATTDTLRDLDALAEHLRGYFVVQVVVDDDGHRRTHIYRTTAAAEKAAARARARGRSAHVTLCQLMPVGVVSANVMGGGPR